MFFAPCALLASVNYVRSKGTVFSPVRAAEKISAAPHAPHLGPSWPEAVVSLVGSGML